jgi:hypothetical protein
MQTKIEQRDPQDLRLHPLQKKYIAEPDKESAEWVSFVDAQSAAGPEGIPPIFITDNGQIMEGGRRWRAAKQLGWPEIGCQARPEEDAAALIVESLLGQRNLQRCVKVYIAITMLEEFVESAEHRRLLHLRNKVKTLEKPLSSNLTKPDSLRALAERFGTSHESVRRAKQVQEIFSNHPDIRAEWEPKLLSGEKNLWNVLSAVGGAGADQSKRGDGVAAAQLEFWNSPFDGLKNALPAWTKLDEEKREAVLNDWRKTAKKLPQDLRDGMREVLDELEGK